MDVVLRPAEPTDADFLTQMLVEAAFWRPDGPRGSVSQVLRDPQLAQYVVGWPRLGDVGVVAEVPEVAETDGAVGAAWLRFFSNDDQGYGFIDADIPELAMGVRRSYRDQGIGSRMLSALLETARESGIPAVSLSVEPDNYARRLYATHGFEVVGAVNGSLTMLHRSD